MEQQPMTREEEIAARRAALVAGSAAMRRNGRATWNDDDWEVAFRAYEQACQTTEAANG